MVTVNIGIEAYTDVDTYARYHGKAVDQSLDVSFWNTQPGKIIGTKRGSFTHEQTVDLDLGSHYVSYGNSGYVPDYAWHAKIYINGKLMAEGDVGRRTHLRADFLLEAAPPPPAKRRSEITATWDPTPDTILAGSTLRTRGRLTDKETGVGLAGRTVKVMWYHDTTYTRMVDAITASDGSYDMSFEVPTTPDIYTYFVNWDGDDVYFGAYTPYTDFRVVAAPGWDVEVTLNVEVAGATRPAGEGEVEVMLEDIGEGLDYRVYNVTGWRPIGLGGKIRFSYLEDPWIVGFDGLYGANRFNIHTRLTADPATGVSKELFLGTTDWR